MHARLSKFTSGSHPGSSRRGILRSLISLENAGNGICKTLDFKIFLGWGCLLFFISHPLQNLLRIDKESQFLAMSNIKFVLLLGASPPGPPTGPP